MTAVRTTSATREFHRATTAYGSALRRAMAERRMTSAALSQIIGVSRNAIHFYREGRYLPRPDVARRIAVALNDLDLEHLASAGRRIRCVVCKRVVWRGDTRRRYCSIECWREVARNAPKVYPHQAAIDAYCMGCEPEGICRTPACPLQPFSPLPLIELHRTGVA